MRPEKASEDMDDCVCDPIELFVDSGMLIVEGRIPDLSPKRRIEGPHCPSLEPDYSHRCDRHREQCRKADQQRKQMLMLCRNNIPMRVDVLLLPKCDHGQLDASTVEGATVSCHALLLERWDIQIIAKRIEKVETGCVTGRFLLQAIKSYLHFSQLSSWMISSVGCLPFEVVYRLYAPGETVNYSFKTVPAIHNFPLTDMTHATMRVSVASTPRPLEMPLLKCLDCDKGRQQKQDKFPKGRSVQRPAASQTETERPHSSKSLGLDQYNLKSLESHQRHKKTNQSENSKSNKSEDMLCLPSRPKSPRVSDEDDGCEEPVKSGLQSVTSREAVESHASAVKKSLYHKPPTGRKLRLLEDICDKSPESSETRVADLKQEINNSMQPECSSASQGASHYCYAKKLLKESLKDKPLSFKPHSKHFVDSDVIIKRLPSPKVLFTTNPKSQNTTYKKRKLDLDDLAENVEDKLMSSNLSDLMKPLHSEELESYLASLSHKLPEKTIHDSINTIPLTKCKFFIGEGTEVNSGGINDINSELVPCDKISEKLQICKPDTGFDAREINSSDNKNLQSNSTFQKQIYTSEELNETRDLSSNIYFPKTSQNKLIKSDKPCQESSKQSPHRDTVTRCLFKSLSEPGPELAKLSISMDKDINHSYRSSHDGSPNGLSFTDDESSDNSTPTNSLSDKFTHNSSEFINNPRSTSDKGKVIRTCSCDSLEDEIANLKLSENGHEGDENSVYTNGSVTDRKKDNKVALGKSLCKHLMTKELNKIGRPEDISMPNQEQIRIFQKNLDKSSSMMFNNATGLPTRSSPAPTKRKSGGRFDYDNTLISAKAIKNALSCSKLALQSESSTKHEESQKVLSTSAPASTNCLLGNFEESVLNGRIEPVGVVEGFTAEIGAGGSFCPKHITLPVTAYFFQLSDDNAPSPYLGHINLESLGKKGYKIPTSGTVQATLFNPNKTVVKMFVVMYDLSDMPANCQTFLRQRTVYMPADTNSTEPSFLRYLIHLRFASSKTGKIYLHTDIRLIFARDKFEFDPRVANYELRSFTEGPQNPKFSPKR